MFLICAKNLHAKTHSTYDPDYPVQESAFWRQLPLVPLQDRLYKNHRVAATGPGSRIQMLPNAPPFAPLRRVGM
jgi:hypothetical protein